MKLFVNQRAQDMYDVAATALDLLGVEPLPEWQLDGESILQQTATAAAAAALGGPSSTSFDLLLCDRPVFSRG